AARIPELRARRTLRLRSQLAATSAAALALGPPPAVLSQRRFRPQGLCTATPGAAAEKPRPARRSARDNASARQSPARRLCPPPRPARSGGLLRTRVIVRRLAQGAGGCRRAARRIFA